MNQLLRLYVWGKKAGDPFEEYEICMSIEMASEAIAKLKIDDIINVGTTVNMRDERVVRESDCIIKYVEPECDGSVTVDVERIKKC